MSFSIRIGVIALMVLAAVGPVRAAKTEKWLRVATPDVVVITTLREKEAVACAGEFAQFVEALRRFLGGDRRRLPPLTIVAFAEERDFERYHPLIGQGGAPQGVGGFFWRRESWAVAGLGGRMSDETRRIVFHEGVHWFFSTVETHTPVWLEEGVAEVFSTFRAEKERAAWGLLIEEHVHALRAGHRPPLARLLNTTRDELFGDDSNHTGLAYAQSWAFTHFLIFGKHDLPRTGMGDYMKASAEGLAPEEAFRRAFGRPCETMDAALAEYMMTGRYVVARDPLAKVAPPETRPATRFEVENALGRLALGGRRWEQARTHAKAAVAEAGEDPRGHELLGLALKEGGDAAGAREAFQTAIRRGTRDFQPYFEEAVAMQGEIVERRGNLKPDEARAIANGYERAINLHPRSVVAFENLASVLVVAEPVRAEDREFLEFGLRLFPDNGLIRLGLAQLSRRSGDMAAARAHLDKALAASAGMSMEAVQAARTIDQTWEYEDIKRRVDELVGKGKFREAVEAIDEAVGRIANPSVRMSVLQVRGHVETQRLFGEVKDAMTERRWADARRVLQALLASDSATQTAKQSARRTLEDLDRRRLGLEPAKR